MTDIYLITGFLGSGKTTFLNHRLTQSNRKVGVLMNEFGSVSMDTIAIKKEGFDIVELKNGSIFCSCLKDHFIEGLARLVKSDLDEIYIESTGLADPSDMGKVMSVLGKLTEGLPFEFKGTLCMIDGVYFEDELESMVNVKRQIQHSHHILLNKIDLIDERKKNDLIQIIKDINPNIAVSCVSHGRIDWEEMSMKYYHIEDEETTNRKDTRPKSMVVKFVEEPTMSQLKLFLSRLGSHFHRIKGYISIEEQFYKVDQVKDIIEFKAFVIDENIKELEGYNELVCLTSKGSSSIAHITQVAKEVLNECYEIVLS